MDRGNVIYSKSASYEGAKKFCLILPPRKVHPQTLLICNPEVSHRGEGLSDPGFLELADWPTRGQNRGAVRRREAHRCQGPKTGGKPRDKH